MVTRNAAGEAISCHDVTHLMTSKLFYAIVSVSKIHDNASEYYPAFTEGK